MYLSANVIDEDIEPFTAAMQSPCLENNKLEYNLVDSLRKQSKPTLALEEHPTQSELFPSERLSNGFDYRTEFS